VTEEQWFASQDPQAMLSYLRDSRGLTERKGRLFGIACCRSIWRVLEDERSRRAVEVAELFAEGMASEDERKEARRSALEATHVGDGLPVAAWAAQRVTSKKMTDVLWGITQNNGVPGAAANAVAALAYAEKWDAQGGAEADAALEAAFVEELVKQATMLRDIFTSRPREIKELRKGPAVMTLADAAYGERKLPEGTLDPQRLAVLADALEESGATDMEILAHLRSNGPHHRGCWALDLLLGKE
jgi:hypothetical protein